MNNLILQTTKITKELENLLKKGVEIFSLSSTDFYTIKDIVEFSDLQDKNLIIILLVLFLSFKNGSLCVKLDSNEIKENILQLDMQPDKVQPDKVIKEFKNNLLNYSKIIANNIKEFKPLIYVKDLSSSIYFHKHFVGENKLKENISRLLDKQHDNCASDKLNSVVKEINRFHPQLNDKQKIAVFLSLIQNFLVISGGPGTGKSSIIRAIVEVLIRLDHSPSRIKVSAPTGRAANRLEDIIKRNTPDNKLHDKLQKIECLTIHRLLEYSFRRGGFDRNKDALLNIDVVIVDEVSMVDVNLMSSLFDALPENAKVIFLGDKDQLPSVNVGAVLSDIIPTEFEEKFTDIIKPLNIQGITFSTNKQLNVNRVVILEKSYRTQGDSLKIAKSIKESKLPNDFESFILSQLKFSENYFKQQSTIGNFLFINYDKIIRNKFISIVKTWANHYILTDEYINLIKQIRYVNLAINNTTEKVQAYINRFFELSKNSKILCTVKNNIYGTNYINTILKEELASKLRINLKNKDYLFEGIPIVIAENDYNLKLFNGDMGIIVRDKNNNLHAIFETNDKSFVLYSTAILPKFDIGFAITVHKSQGSEYNNIFLTIPDKSDIPLLTREIIYTGLTRSKNNCMIYGNLNVFKQIINKKINRQSNLNIW